jgi:UDP-N-acetylmuramyl pentapeptide synthase
VSDGQKISTFNHLGNFREVYILDTIHGAGELKRGLGELGIGCEAIDVYKEGNLPKFSNDDVVIAPVHLGSGNPFLKGALDEGCKILSHHLAVRDLFNLKKFLKGSVKIEITGTIGKTSAAVVLASILKMDGKSVLLHSSSGTYQIDGGWKAMEKCSITPANILSVAEKVLKDEFTPDFAIFETSLGFTGIGDVNILTSLKEDYMIASNTRWASEVKLDSIKNLKSDSLLVAPSELFRRLEAKHSTLSFNTFGEQGDSLYIVCKESTSASGKNSKMSMVYDDLKTIDGKKISGKIDFCPDDIFFFLKDFYGYPISSSVATALSLNVEEDKIKELLDGFSGIENRMEFRKERGIDILDNSNSGTRLNHLENVLSSARLDRKYKRIFLIIGEESEYICDGFSPLDVKTVLSRCKRYFDDLVCVGNGYHLEEGNNFDCARKKTLDDATRYILSMAEKEDLIISFVKTWR